MIPSRFRVDIFGELEKIIGAYEPLVLTEVLHELSGLSLGHGRDGSAARFALTLAEKCHEVSSGYSRGSVDEKVLWYALEHSCMVVTNDKGLRDLLLSAGVPVISLMHKKKLGILRR